MSEATVENFDADTRDAAAESLFAGMQESTPEPVEPVAQQGETPEAEAPVQETQVPASREIDLTTLPDEARQYIEARERELTGDYTRKTQEAAAQRQEAEQALQFIEALNTDPDFARQVYGALAETLEVEGTANEWDDAYEPDDPYAAKLAELDAWKGDLERQFEEAQWNAHVDRQISEIRSANPAWNDDDINDVIGLGFATQGDLHKAAEMFTNINNRVVSKYVEQKSSVNTASPLPFQSAQVPPEGFTGIEDKRLHDAGMEALRAALG